MTPDTDQPGAAPTLDRAKCRTLINWVPNAVRLPHYQQVRDLGDQLQAALTLIANSDTRVDNAQNETLRYQRELETANAEVRQLREEVITLRAAQVKAPAATSKPSAAAPEVNVPAATPPAPKKRGPRAKVVPISTQAAAQ
jgi:hypothetical protein